jgi:hypothetical protein
VSTSQEGRDEVERPEPVGPITVDALLRGERRERLARARAARARRNPGVGLALISSGVVIFTGVFLALWLAGVTRGNWPGLVMQVVFVVAFGLVTFGRRIRAGGAERVLAKDARAPIVYLRPFRADGAQIARRMWSRARISPRETLFDTYEERLARTLRKIGPFVAVGDPTERLPLLGAARMYAADEDWQATVGELMSHAAVVLLHAGEGTGFGWEVRRVIERGAPERTILSLPLEAKRRGPSRQERYDAFRSEFGHHFPRPLPETIGFCQFAYFDGDWTPRLLGERGAPLPDGEDGRAQALRRLAHEFKITWGPRWARLTLYTSAFLGVLAGLEALISSAG